VITPYGVIMFFPDGKEEGRVRRGEGREQKGGVGGGELEKERERARARERERESE
jgi:hypothetical protein